MNPIDKLISWKTLKKYLPDILILSGIFIFSWKALMPKSGLRSGIPCFGCVKTYNQEFKLFAIMLVALGIDIIVRRYLICKKGETR